MSLMIRLKTVLAALTDASMKQKHTEGNIEQLKEEALGLKNRVRELEKQLELEQAAKAYSKASEDDQSFEEAKKAVECEYEKRLKLIRSLIKFRDQLLIFKDNAENEAAVKLLLNLYRETGRFMSGSGVEILNQGGDFSPDYHIVTETVETDRKELVNTIESIFRDGYIVDGKMLRPQEVVVYVVRR